MPIINCTPHPLNIHRKDGTVLNLPKGTVVPRLDAVESAINMVEGIEIFVTNFGVTKDLPDEIEGTYLVVSRMVLDANPDRADLLSPGAAVRDDKGNIIGCKGLTI